MIGDLWWWELRSAFDDAAVCGWMLLSMGGRAMMARDRYQVIGNSHINTYMYYLHVGKCNA